MRKTTACLIAILTCAWVNSFGQSNGKPQWKVVKEFHLTGQTQSAGPITLFTPSEQGFYRVTVYLAAFTNMNQASGWSAAVSWTDRTGLAGTIITSTDLGDGNSYSVVGPQSFSPKAGAPVQLFVEPQSPPPQNSTYDIELNIEELTH